MAGRQNHEIKRLVSVVCGACTVTRFVCSELRKIGLMTAKAQFSAHSFSIAPMMDRDDKLKKPIG